MSGPNILYKEPFYLDNYLNKLRKPGKIKTQSYITQIDQFNQLCETVKLHFKREWEESEGKRYEESDKMLSIQKNAIIGYQQEVNYFKSKISDFLKKNNLMHYWKPRWYTDLVTAIFQENWGYCGVDQWKRMPKSSSCKIIGERIYFLINGKMELQEQTISRERLEQLIRALLLRTPDKRLDKHTEEVYMVDGTRIKIYTEGLTKEPVIIFRKYIVDQYRFEEQVRLGTIPEDSPKLFESMVKLGFNVNFLGPVRSGKSTFLTTWQSYEDPSLEGIMVETDPEIPMHVIMPKAPIIQLVADGESLKDIVKDLMRADGDYIIMAEARDGIALKIAVTVANKGTRRVKSTFHSSDASDFCYDAATEIVQVFGGDVFAYTIKVAKSYHYLFEFIQLPRKDMKRLKGIYEVRYDPRSLKVTTHQICKYDPLNDNWTFKYDIGVDKEEIGLIENSAALKQFKSELKNLAEKYPMEGEHITELPYFKYAYRG